MKIKTITIEQGAMGYVAQVGCQKAGFSNKEDLIKALTDYINDPEGMEKKYYDTTLIPNPETPREPYLNSAPIMQGEGQTAGRLR